jgi:hypothetical protein
LKQYDYLYEIEPFNIGKEKYERQVFLNLYTKVEEKWLDFTMSLRNEQVEPSLVFLEAKDTEIRKKIEAALINNANLFVVGSFLCSNTYFTPKNSNSNVKEIKHSVTCPSEERKPTQKR